MQLKPAKERGDPVLDAVKLLYETSFPMSERRLWSDLMRMLGCSQMQLHCLIHNNAFSGFVILWPFQTFLYIEHMAVSPMLRGNGYGQALLRKLVVEYGTVVLESELPASAEAKRRLEFYRRVGIRVLPFTYCQPPYRRGDAMLPMHLLSNCPIGTTEDFNAIVTKIHLEVYEKFW